MDFGIIGVSGIDIEGSLLDFDGRETETAKAIINNSDKVMLVADHSKFGRRAMIQFGNFNDVNELYTDQVLQNPYFAALKAAKVNINIAPSEVDTLGAKIVNG